MVEVNIILYCQGGSHGIRIAFEILKWQRMETRHVFWYFTTYHDDPFVESLSRSSQQELSTEGQ